ncbi:hypothetical protein PoB_002699700 [Plakobranchus ocellatus]|uniref:Uncharacterized protein n=1 Tax=Plakobranchus ocellatus TaxID=259542 RepID=A0AAV4A0V2_9GAST|nr:hypothetical protein PoB_002699700 [Plakobranchus ocellatus]
MVGTITASRKEKRKKTCNSSSLVYVLYNIPTLARLRCISNPQSGQNQKKCKYSRSWRWMLHVALKAFTQCQCDPLPQGKQPDPQIAS